MTDGDTVIEELPFSKLIADKNPALENFSRNIDYISKITSFNKKNYRIATGKTF